MNAPRMEVFAVLTTALAVVVYLEFLNDGTHDGPHQVGLLLCLAGGIVLAWLLRREETRP